MISNRMNYYQISSVRERGKSNYPYENYYVSELSGFYLSEENLDNSGAILGLIGFTLVLCSTHTVACYTIINFMF